MTRKDTPRHHGRRRRMLEELREKGITSEEVLQAMERVPRHLYIDPTFEDKAYTDIPIRISDKQTISQPFTVAYQTQLLELKAGMKVLEIGTGSAYQASVLAEMGVQVYTIERIRNLYLKARHQLDLQNYFRIRMRYGDGFEGWPEEAPFDRIIVTAAAPNLPTKLKKQLKVGGMINIPVGEEGAEQRLWHIVRKTEEVFEQKDKGAVRFVPMLEGKISKYDF